MDFGALLILMCYIYGFALIIIIPAFIFYYINASGMERIFKKEGYEDYEFAACIPIYNEYRLGKMLKEKYHNSAIINKWIFTFGFLLYFIANLRIIGLAIWLAYRALCLWQVGYRYKKSFSTILTALFFLHGLGFMIICPKEKKEKKKKERKKKRKTSKVKKKTEKAIEKKVVEGKKAEETVEEEKPTTEEKPTKEKPEKVEKKKTTKEMVVKKEEKKEEKKEKTSTSQQQPVGPRTARKKSKGKYKKKKKHKKKGKNRKKK